jgi:hypothetical protein
MPASISITKATLPEKRIKGDRVILRLAVWFLTPLIQFFISRYYNVMEYFIYIQDLRLLCCRSCKYMVTWHRIQAHLCGRPHGLIKKDINKVQLWAKPLDLIDGDDEILTLPYIPDNSPLIKALGKPKSGGFRCTATIDCRRVNVNPNRGREHLSKSYGIFSRSEIWSPKCE